MNNGSWLPEEDFKGLSNNFFDDLIDHIDFPLEDIETADDDGDWDAAGFQDLVPPSLDVLTSLSSEFICKGQQRVKQSSSSDVSSTVDNSASDVKVSKLFPSSSPVSVLENTNGCTLSQTQNRIQRLAFSVKGIRSKRKRPTTLKLKFGFLQSFVSGMSQQSAPDDDESDSETYLSSESSAKKKRKKNKTRPSPNLALSNCPEQFNSDGTLRTCSHCETTRTPQWREGPNGPKTLCNACGVRFRSGRLVPEYRPASSPTFIPTRHSNSHRKIIEMRKKDEDQFTTGRIRAMTSGA